MSQEVKSPRSMRFIQIALGIVAIVLSIFIILNPGLATVSLVIVLAVLLLIVGIEKIISGIFVKNKSRLATIGLGALVIILAIAAMTFPIASTILLILILAFALLFDGISRVTHGIGHKEDHKIHRFFGIAVGIISIILAIFIMVSPAVGMIFVSLIIGISLLITGIQILTSGVIGRDSGLVSFNKKETKQ
ncbi:MAG: DUF308 domain-containing protein [Nitrososphaeraceae archaeon]